MQRSGTNRRSGPAYGACAAQWLACTECMKSRYRRSRSSTSGCGSSPSAGSPAETRSTRRRSMSSGAQRSPKASSCAWMLPGATRAGSAFNASASASASRCAAGKPSASSGSPSVAAKLNSTSRSSSIRYGIR
ncbi:hypothetical protein BURPSS13_C0090 [Burkholderia pseudomallei S13]|nr:hypothetical protein BURPSS13_C0090 [Burkholderia pseudomallei S13]